MARKRFAELENGRRERILTAAAEEFAGRGYEAASVNRIIAAAGISKGSLYYYFDDKEDLFVTVVEHASQQIRRESGALDLGELTGPTYWNTFRDLMLRSMDYIEANEWYVRLAQSFVQFRSSVPSSPALQRVHDAAREKLTALLQRGQDFGVVRSDLPLEMLVGVVFAVKEVADRNLLEHWDERSREERLRQAAAQLDLVRDMLHKKNEGWEE